MRTLMFLINKLNPLSKGKLTQFSGFINQKDGVRHWKGCSSNLICYQALLSRARGTQILSLV